VIGDSIVVDPYGNKMYASGMCDLHGADKRLYRSDDGIRRAVISQWAIGGPVALIRSNALDTVNRWTEGLRIDDWDFSSVWRRATRLASSMSASVPIAFTERI
jgi:hypothetical protein